MSATRNLGLRHAKGEYIALLDADDLWLSHKLQRQAGILDLNPKVSMVYGPTVFWYGWTGKPEDIKRDETSKLGVDPNNLFRPPELMTHFLSNKGGYVPWMCALMVRKSALEEVNGFEENFKGLYEDQVFYAKMALNHHIYVDEDLSSKYRQHPWSACALAEKSGIYNSRGPNPAESIYLKWLCAYISRKGINDPGLKTILQERVSA